MDNIEFSKWDYDVSGIKIYKIDASWDIDKIQELILNMEYENFIFTRIDACDLEKINALISIDFYIADILSSYKYNIDFTKKYIKSSKIQLINENDVDYSTQCQKIVDNEFKLGHIYQDKNLGIYFGNKIYNAWYLNNLKGRAKTFSYIENDIVLGFAQVIVLEADILQIDLIATDSRYQSQGIGGTLIDYIKNYAFLNNINSIIVGTQSTNCNACNFYSKKNFIKMQSSISLHFKKER